MTKYIDFTVQSLIMGISLVLILVSIRETDWMLNVLVAQLALGLWQFVSSCTSVSLQSSHWKLKRIHMFSSILYLLLLWGSFQADVSYNFVKYFITIPAWSLAIFYYSITWSVTCQKQRRSSFLPHLNF